MYLNYTTIDRECQDKVSCKKEKTDALRRLFFFFSGQHHGNSGRLRAVPTGGTPGRPLKDLLRCGGRRPLRRVRGVAANGRRYGGCGRGGGWKRTAGCRPYGGRVPVLSLRDQSADWSWQSVTPSPFPMFSNGNLKTPQFSILNFEFARCGRQWRPMAAATAGADGKRREADGRVPSLRRESPVSVIARAGTARGNPSPPVPYGGKVPVLSLRASAHTGVAIRFPRPFPMFSNGNLKTPQFSIINYQFARCGRGGRPMAAATACADRAGGQWPPLRRVRAGRRREADGRVPSLRREGAGFVIARPALHKFRQPNMPR